jgi:hypothetical protein
MTNILIFTGTSRTDPNEFRDPDNKIHTSLRSIGAYQVANELRKHNYTVQVVDNFPWLVKNNFQLILKNMDTNFCLIQIGLIIQD